MERRNIREGKLPFAMQLLAQQHEGPSSLGKTDSDDEFFDCDDDRVVDEEGKAGDKSLLHIFLMKFFSHSKNMHINLHGIQSDAYQNLVKCYLLTPMSHFIFQRYRIQVD